MFDLTQTIHNVESAGDLWLVAITVCLILTTVCFKLFFFFNEKAKEGSLSENTATLGRDLSSIATIIFALGLFASIVLLQATKNAAMIEPASEVQAWAKERYGVEMTQEQGLLLFLRVCRTVSLSSRFDLSLALNRRLLLKGCTR